ncbi:molybdate ABC transporter substrate-binding protein [Leptospirillum ferriphilum]|uniref:Molybdenum ABC transporter substrate-binding protein n=1 Tax=Leptospirillum ferriphilum YSK TaxID=1441628 RepID=A0A059XXM1_9BACT|nr:molybdate ABC transporter substrate-binding protein [Leptospirillum ferriphilum]AIA31850.1 hypothetical protein Y981_08920 [Leptospirillum ferriphilum YSK]OOH77675.1 molybdate ABC transporter substrate-binding protein [Leptospirillum ferriphilum]
MKNITGVFPDKKKKMKGFVFLILLSAILCRPIEGHPASVPLRVAAAADLMPVLPPLLDRFTRKTGIPVIVSWGASGEESVAIRHGAPYDLFLSADSAFPEALARMGFLEKNSLRVYARGILVLWISRPGPLKKPFPGISELDHPGIRKIAMANPRLAPYGRAAKRCLVSRGRWTALKPKVVYGNSLAQVAWYLRTGSAQAGFLSESQAKMLPSRLSGGFSILSPGCAPDLEQKMGILRRTRNPGEAKSLETFLLGAKAQSYLRSHGYR